MREIDAKIQEVYEDAGFVLTVTEPNRFTFQNPFSVHFVFLFEALSDLAEGWRSAHGKLIENYVTSGGPKDLEWNYYAVFVILEKNFSDEELRLIRSEIQGDTEYSRKFVMETVELSNLPPGILHFEELQSKKLDTSSALQVWDRQLGKELFQVIMRGPKKSLEDRLRNLINRRQNEK